MTGPFTREALAAIVAAAGRTRQSLIPILQQVQRRWNYLPPELFRWLPEMTEITPAELGSVATFYHGFRLRPAGRHIIKVCVGTACHVKGADKVFEAFREALGLKEGEDTSQDDLFTVSQVACLGCCSLAVAVQIDTVVYGWVEPTTVKEVLQEFLSEAEAPSVPGADTGLLGNAGEVRLCLCSSCRAAGSQRIRQALEECIGRLRLPVRIREVGCTGMSYLAPLLEVVCADDRRYNYARLEPDAAEPVLLEHFKPVSLNQRLQLGLIRIAETLLQHDSAKTVFRHRLGTGAPGDTPGCCAYAGQVRLATEFSGTHGPDDLAAYRQLGGFSALERSLTMEPGEIIETVVASGLRGRGGGGYPTGAKWRQVASQPDPDKVVVCNADEGDPGAFMDRMLLESFPFRILEGMLVAARAVGASAGFVYVREEYPLAVQRIRQAVADAEQAGWLGERIGGTEFSFRISVVEGAGAFVCGEETALIASLEGRRGAPVFRPPFPSQSGYLGHPTLINNVETFALVPWILGHGAPAFAALGTTTSKGTKTFALAGKAVRSGLVEVPMGMSLRQIVEELGGGVQPGRILKAVQVGGPSGGCVPASLADLPVDYEALQQAGTIMGSGGLVVLDNTDCMVDIARYFLKFTRAESCGKCTCCRIGTVLMLEILERICAGQGRPEDLPELERIGRQMQRSSLCGLGRTAANPALSTLVHFREEYEAHLQGRCPAGKCTALIHYEIGDRCIGCTRCSQQCPAGAIPFTPYERHRIDQAKCVKCGACLAACPQHAIKVT